MHQLNASCNGGQTARQTCHFKGDPTPDVLADVTSSLPYDRESGAYKIETKKELDEIETYAHEICGENNEANRALYGSNAPEWTCEVTSKQL